MIRNLIFCHIHGDLVSNQIAICLAADRTNAEDDFRRIHCRVIGDDERIRSGLVIPPYVIEAHLE
ncbi:hypothetical protein D3C72_1477550 [compost metagenome]